MLKINDSLNDLQGAHNKIMKYFEKSTKFYKAICVHIPQNTVCSTSKIAVLSLDNVTMSQEFQRAANNSGAKPRQKEQLNATESN